MNFHLRFVIAIALGVASTGAQAIAITATQDASVLVNALLAGGSTGIVVTGSTLNGHAQTVDLTNFNGSGSATLTSSGTYTNLSGTYGIGPGVALTTGSVAGFTTPDQTLYGYSDGADHVDNNAWGYFDDPNVPVLAAATPAQELLLDPITGDPVAQTFYDHFDVTELIINFDMQAGVNTVAFNIVFGSEEWEEFRDSPYIDGFGMFLNGVNIAKVGGLPVNIKHPDMKPELDQFLSPIAGTEIPGTELDGILAPGRNPVLTFSGLVNPTGNELRFIVADTSDNVYDTTVYFSALTGVVPAPPAIWLLGTAVAGLFGRGFAKRRPQTADAT